MRDGDVDARSARAEESAIGGTAAPFFGHGDERGLARLHHAETLAREPLELVGILELLDPVREPLVLLLESLVSLSRSAPAPLREELAQRNDRERHDEQEDREAGPPAAR